MSKNYAQNLYIENYKTLIREIQDLNKRHPVFIDWATHHNKDANASQIYKFNAIPMKIPARVIVDINKGTLKFK